MEIRQRNVNDFNPYSKEAVELEFRRINDWDVDPQPRQNEEVEDHQRPAQNEAQDPSKRRKLTENSFQKV